MKKYELVLTKNMRLSESLTEYIRIEYDVYIQKPSKLDDFGRYAAYMLFDRKYLILNIK